MILVIDDDADDFDLLAEAIRTVNPSAALRYFPDAEDCLNELQTMELEPSIILLDLNMPKMDGFTFLEEFRKNKPLSKIPVVVMTTSFVKEHKKKCATLGVVSYISKPTSWQGLLDAAKNILKIQGTFS